MSLPQTLLQLAEGHRCFSGCYSSGHAIQVVINPAEEVIDTQCVDCLSFRIGTTSTHAPGMDPSKLSEGVSAHVRAFRGYALSFGGYHTQAGGFWLSAAYWAQPGIFLLSRRGRGTSGQSPVDLLVQAFSSGVSTAPHPAMTDPKEYVSHDVFLDVTALSQPPSSLAALLASPCVSPNAQSGFVGVTLAEFLPVASISSAAQVSSVVSASADQEAEQSPRQPPGLGERCGICNEIVKGRSLFSSTYVGCACN